MGPDPAAEGRQADRRENDPTPRTPNGPGLLGARAVDRWCGYCWGCCWSSNVW